MSAYVIVDIDVHDSESYEEYKKLAPGSVAAHGGKYLARGGATDVLEGDWIPKRLVILEFPTMEQAKAWLHSSEYDPIKQIRHKCASSNMIVIEGA